MRFTYNWLKQYVDFSWSPQELAEKLTFAGIEVEKLTTRGGQIPDAVVIAQILSSEKHPNADKLSVCRVTDGTSERQIVCGAKNYQVGDRVPLALPGAAMAGGFTIKVSKLRGVESQGMMCSAEELGLSPGADGLLILPADAPLGKKFAEYAGPGDTVFEIEVTPNRPDWLSVIGIAREIGALTGQPLRRPECALSENDPEVATLARVTVDAPDVCARYTARVIRGVTVGPSPAWLRQVLESVGMRSINNVVDVTNYVLLETGHPLHAFDYQLLQGRQIIVRRARMGERFTALDGSQHELTDDMLVIADAERAVALAGIMGGQNSEITGATTDVLLESAHFLPRNIRRTSKQLGLASESSYRFERGTDITGLVWASQRAAALLQQVTRGQVAHGLIDALAQPVRTRRVRCRLAQINRVLGIDVPPATVRNIFTHLGLTVVPDAADATVEVEIPTFRVDLEREADLIEEVCRIHGVEQIPARRQPAVAVVTAEDGRWDALRRVRQTLTALGFHEALNQTMVNAGEVKLHNPLSSDMTALRESLVPGLLRNLRTNVTRHQYDVRLFEIGRVFPAAGGESLRLALAATGRRSPGDRERLELVDYFDLKGALEELGMTGEICELPPAQARRMDFRDPVVTVEVELEPLLMTRSAGRQYRELPRYPAVERDVALVVAESVRHAEVMTVMDRHRTKHLEQVVLFDIFRGGPIPAGKKSLAYRLTYRAGERTLTDAEVNEAQQQLTHQLQRELQCEIRES